MHESVVRKIIEKNGREKGSYVRSTDDRELKHRSYLLRLKKMIEHQKDGLSSISLFVHTRYQAMNASQYKQFH